jgi:hypothetical protein
MSVHTACTQVEIQLSHLKGAETSLFVWQVAPVLQPACSHSNAHIACNILSPSAVWRQAGGQRMHAATWQVLQ